ncbi:MAG TPA: VWA domain-containing protein [Pyrinomonadaceae bacterium]|nr:VWA domain-containing protein [Pyrinomonadaceae bacterium]
MPLASPIIKTAKFFAATPVSLCLPLCLIFCVLVLTPTGRAQIPQDTPPEPKDQSRQNQTDVLRVYTELVQTDVMVFDKQGRFANGLTAADFELRIDGKLKPVEFFEKVTAGSVNEEVQLAAARGASVRPTSTRSASPAPLDRGRPIFFYVDDLHMDLSSLQTTRKLITRFIDSEMGQNDEAAITSASGQIGFLQQLTDNKSVLRAALDRIKLRPYFVKDFERPTMTEYQAIAVINNDRELLQYYIDAIIRDYPSTPVNMAESRVRARAAGLARQGYAVTTNTLIGLEGLVRAAKDLPGRKLVIFLSGGFLLGDSSSDSRYRLQRITSAAARSGVVIYSMDARGLVANLLDASSGAEFDMSGVLSRSSSGELNATQDGLHALAKDTGGKTVFNTNALDAGLSRALKETDTYYLLAWKPEPDSHHASKFRRIEVKVVGRPDLTVQVRRGFFDREPEAVAAKTEPGDKAKKESETAKTPEAQLRKVMLAPYPLRDIPLTLDLTYLNTADRGPKLSAFLQVPHEVLSFAPANGKLVATIAVAGAVLDDKGNAGGAFNNRINIEAASVAAVKSGQSLTYAYPLYVKPGLYQVRVGVRDVQSGRSGTAHSWIEVPNIASGQLALSSLLLGLRTQPEISNTPESAPKVPEPVDLSIAHRFAPNGYLRFMLVVYNAARAPADSKPDVAIQVQVVREEQPVLTTALRRIQVENNQDLATIPYAAELSLNGLPTGRYVLHVTVVDRVTKQSASQQTRFEIE